MRICYGTAIAPRKAHIAGCKGTAVCADTQCLLRHCVSVVANGTREYLWDGPRFPCSHGVQHGGGRGSLCRRRCQRGRRRRRRVRCERHSVAGWCRSATRDDRPDARAGPRAIVPCRATSRACVRGRLLRGARLLRHASQWVRAAVAATANPFGAAQTRTRRPWPVAASRARPEACWAQGRRDSALQSVAAADALRRPQTLPAERAAADSDGVPPCVGCGRPMDSLPLSFAHLARALHMGD